MEAGGPQSGRKEADRMVHTSSASSLIDNDVLFVHLYNCKLLCGAVAARL
jgi:hypothetical protein